MALPIGEKDEVVGWYSGEHGAIRPCINAVFEDEPCLYLGEFNKPSQSGKSKSRYQMLRVVRNDRLVDAVVYLGPSRSFIADQFQIMGGDPYTRQVFHTVGELREMADNMRSAPLHREQEPSDLQAAFRNMIEERHKRRKHQTTILVEGALQR